MREYTDQKNSKYGHFTQWMAKRIFSNLSSMLLIEVWECKTGLVFLDPPENSRLCILLNFAQNAWDQLKYKQTLKHARKMYAAMQQATEWRMQSIVNVSSALYKRFIMNDLHERTAFDVEQYNGLFALQIFAGKLQI